MATWLFFTCEGMLSPSCTLPMLSTCLHLTSVTLVANNGDFILISFDLIFTIVSSHSDVFFRYFLIIYRELKL